MLVTVTTRCQETRILAVAMRQAGLYSASTGTEEIALRLRTLILEAKQDGKDQCDGATEAPSLVDSCPVRARVESEPTE